MNKVLRRLIKWESNSVTLSFYGLMIGISATWSFILLSVISDMAELIAGVALIFIAILISWRAYIFYLNKTASSRRAIYKAKLRLKEHNSLMKRTDNYL
jgi:hypothetical protein